MGDSSENIVALQSPITSNPDLVLRNLEKYELYTDPHGDLRYAKFSLSMSDTESVRTNRTGSQSSFDYEIESSEDNVEPSSCVIKPYSLELSHILGISEDEKAENRLAHAALKHSTVGNSTDFSEDKEFDFLKEKALRKCISLKSSKTPPTTPGKKKAVRFADALGLDLTSIRHVINIDEPPIVPESAMRDLNLKNEPISADVIQVRRLCICFSSPDNCPDFLRRVQERKVLLENCFVDDQKGLVYGKVRVMNIAFNKLVTVRYTMNGWLTHTDVSATYDSGSNDGATDKFSYSIQVPEYFQLGNSLEFSVMYVSANQSFWDNNYGCNYRIECYLANESSKFF